jgi:hypothetical protein
LGLAQVEQQKNEENCVMKSFTICALHRYDGLGPLACRANSYTSLKCSVVASKIGHLFRVVFVVIVVIVTIFIFII